MKQAAMNMGPLPLGHWRMSSYQITHEAIAKTPMTTVRLAFRILDRRFQLNSMFAPRTTDPFGRLSRTQMLVQYAAFDKKGSNRTLSTCFFTVFSKWRRLCRDHS